MGCLGARGVWGGSMDMESDDKGTPQDILTNIEDVYVPHLLYDVLMEGRSMCGMGW